MYTRGAFARAFLPRVGAQVTARNMRAMMAWMQAEGDAGRFNPLNTTLSMPGSWDFNWVGVQSYATFWDGVEATAETLNYGARENRFGYRPIRYHLHKNHAAWKTLKAVEASVWGTGGLALLCLPQVATFSSVYQAHPLAE